MSDGGSIGEEGGSGVSSLDGFDTHLLRVKDFGLINPSVNGGGDGSHGEDHGHDLWIKSNRKLIDEGDRVCGACSGNEVLEVPLGFLTGHCLSLGKKVVLKSVAKTSKVFVAGNMVMSRGGDFGIFVGVESFIDVEVNPHGFDPLGGVCWFSREVGREGCLDLRSRRRHGGLGSGWTRWCSSRSCCLRGYGRGRGSGPRDSSYGGLDKSGRDTNDAGAGRCEFNVRVRDGRFFITVAEVGLPKAPKSGWNLGGEMSCFWIGGTREILDLLLCELEALTKRHYVLKEEEKWTRGSREFLETKTRA
ncbi:hypothetical protein OG21DRAFT_1526028 [Imleria badia]|nr:hypothetical protein OG21DRAFT_1526028 [Imleria badia]